MEDIGKKIHQLRIDNGMTLEELGNKVGVGKSTVRKWENGMISSIKSNKLLELSNALGVLPTDLMDIECSNVRRISYKKRIPVLGRISAGIPMFADENIESYEYVENSNVDYALRVKGNSMIGARICDGDIVYISKDQCCENGDIVIARVNGDEDTVKRFYKYGNEIILHPENPSMNDMKYPADEVTIDGKVIEVKFKI